MLTDLDKPLDDLSDLTQAEMYVCVAPVFIWISTDSAVAPICRGGTSISNGNIQSLGS